MLPVPASLLDMAVPTHIWFRGVSTRKGEQRESCELGFIGGKMRTAAREAAPQIALIACSEEAVGEGQYIRFCWRGSSRQLSAHVIRGFLLDMRRYHGCFSGYEEMRGLGSWSQFLKIPELSEDLLHQFPWSTECLTLHCDLPSGHVESQQLQQHRIPSPQRQMANALGKHQFIVDSKIT